MSEEKTKIAQSIWSVKINQQPLYTKAADGLVALVRITPEENEKIAEVLDNAIADCSRVLSGRESKRERLSSRNLDDSEKPEIPKQSIWTVRINTQLLYKKTLKGRTILFGMNEREHKKVAKVMDSAIDALVDLLKDRTQMREVVVEEKEQITIADPLKYEADAKREEERFEAEKESEKEKSKEVNDENNDKQDMEDDDTVIIDNKLKKEIKKKKKKSDSKSSFWDNLK